MAEQGSDDHRRSRRAMVRKAALVGATGLTLGLAGCATGIEDGPTPHIVTHESEPPFDEVTTDTTVTVTAFVANHGEAGEVEVIAETRINNEPGAVETESVVIEMDESSQRGDVEFEMAVSARADFLDVRAEPAP